MKWFYVKGATGNLTKEKADVSDVTNASRSHFMDLDTRDYDDDLLFLGA
ncbi:uncharacterized protein PRCAT00004855001 [Priceomyces carsonii]|nr:unnamed protein product [Priceomyces carsonii]